jgi:hypothetical protein
MADIEYESETQLSLKINNSVQFNADLVYWRVNLTYQMLITKWVQVKIVPNEH